MTTRRWIATACWLSLCICTAHAVAQSPPAAAGDVQQQFAEVQQQWRGLLKQMSAVQLQFKDAPAAEQETLRAKFASLRDQSDQLEPRLIAAAEAAYTADPKNNAEAERLLVAVLKYRVVQDDYEPAFRIAQALVANGANVQRLDLLTGVAAFTTNHMELAKRHLEKARDTDQLTPPTQNNPLENKLHQFSDLVLNPKYHYRQWWAEEQKIRAEESQADDLPRVKLTTNQGDILIELFENQAPNTVANFIQLVEKGFYNGLTFHRVLAGFMAQGGCPDGNGMGGPDHTIPCECYRPNYRRHFRGTLSMAHAGKNTGGSQFFLTFVPTPHLDGRHTAFGRVVEGMDVLAKLKRRNPDASSKPDVIEQATVVRKRNHAYQPQTLPARR